MGFCTRVSVVLVPGGVKTDLKVRGHLVFGGVVAIVDYFSIDHREYPELRVDTTGGTIPPRIAKVVEQTGVQIGRQNP